AALAQRGAPPGMAPSRGRGDMERRAHEDDAILRRAGASASTVLENRVVRTRREVSGCACRPTRRTNPSLGPGRGARRARPTGDHVGRRRDHPQRLSRSRFQVAAGRRRGRRVKLQYYPDTDSLYIELTPTPGTDSRELADGLVADFDAEGNVVGLDIDR